MCGVRSGGAATAALVENWDGRDGLLLIRVGTKSTRVATNSENVVSSNPEGLGACKLLLRFRGLGEGVSGPQAKKSQKKSR